MIGKFSQSLLYQACPNPVRVALEGTLPKAVSEIVQEYAVEVSADAVATPLETDIGGRVVGNEKNRSILKAIECALMMPEFDSAAKRKIFANAIENGYVETINLVMGNIRKRGEKIYLDDTDLSELSLAEFDFSGVSAIKANFTKSYLWRLDGANLSGAILVDASMATAQLVGAILVGTTLIGVTLNYANFDKATFSDLTLEKMTMIGLSMLGTKFSNVKFIEIFVSEVNTDDASFKEFIKDFSLSGCTYSSPVRALRLKRHHNQI